MTNEKIFLVRCQDWDDFVAERQDVIEITPELEEKITNELDNEGMIKRVILLKLVPEIVQKFKESVNNG